MKYTRPDYYASFACLADKCPDNCCHGWEVVPDRSSLERYRKLEDGEWLTKHIACEDGEYYFADTEDGKCPFLDEDGLCVMQKRLSEEGLCVTCRRYPRFVNYFGAAADEGLELSCPEAARLILTQNGSEFVTTEESGEIVPNDIEPQNYVRGRRLLEELLYIARGSAVSIWERMKDCLRRCGAEKPASVSGRRLAARCIERMERLNDCWQDELIEYLTEGETNDYLLPQQEAENVFIYYLFRYFTVGIETGRFDTAAAFAVLNTFFVLKLWEMKKADTQDERIRLAYQYARETEHSDVNLDILWYAAKPESVMEVISN